MINAQDENEVLEDNQDTDEYQDTESNGDEVSEESVGEETGETDEEESVSISRAELEKLRRESAAARRLREKVGKEGGKKGGEESSGINKDFDQELISRTYLAAQAGIKDKEVQDEALRLAEKFGMNIAEAMSDADISTRLTNLQKRKEAQRAVAKSTGGSTSRTKDVSFYLEYFKKNGDFPAGTPTSMIARVTESLAD